MPDVPALSVALRIPQPEPHPRPFPEPADPRRRPDPPPRPEPQPDGIPTPDPEPRPRPLGSSRRGLTWGGVLLLLGGCDQWSLSINSQGLFLSISIVGDDDPARHRYRMRARDSEGTTRTVELPQSGPLPLRGFAPGPLEVTLLPPPSCRVSGPNPRTISANAEEVTSLNFEVHCDH
jgi:hypothetical protein